MKLRIKGNSLRLRITQPELTRLMLGGSVQETIQFGPEPEQQLIYRLQVGSDRIRADYTSGMISVSVPAQHIRAWSDPGEVSLSAAQHVGEGRELNILIEKDFVCLDAADQQDADAFPNPSALRCQ